MTAAAAARRERARQRVLGMMAAKGDLVEVAGAPTHFLMPISAGLLDALAAFGSEFEDLEPGPDDEDDPAEDEGDAEPDSDREGSITEDES